MGEGSKNEAVCALQKIETAGGKLKQMPGL